MTKKQIGKRFLQILIVLFGISFLTFGLTYLSPGDPAEIMLTECGNLPTPELLEQTRHELGLDQPFLVQYGTWLKGVLTGDMGQSYSFTETCILFLANPEDVSAGTAYDDRDFHSAGNPGSSVSEQIPGLLCKRNYFYRGIRTKLLAWPDLTEYFRCTASPGECSRRKH